MTGPYMELKLSRTLTRPLKFRVFYLTTQKQRSMISITFKCCGQLAIYIRPELVLFLTVIITGNLLSCGTGIVQPVSYTVGVAQGDPLATVAYGIGVLTLTK